MASALLTGIRSAVKARRAARSAVLPQAPAAFARTSLMASSSQLVGDRLQDGGAFGLRRRWDQLARDGVADVEMLDGDAAHVLGGDLGDGGRPIVDLVDRQAEHHAF